MCSISDLPTEVLEQIFSTLSVDDQRYARRVCRRWNDQLTLPRYFKATKLRLEPSIVPALRLDELPGCFGEGKLYCLEVNDLIELDGRISLIHEHITTTVQLLAGSRNTLEEFRLRDCPDECLMAIYGELVKMRRLRHLKVDVSPANFRDIILPAVPRAVSESVGFALVTHLEVTLGNESFVTLVGSLASQLRCLTLTVFWKELLLRCWNELQLDALRSLTVINGDPQMPLDFIQPEELGAGCWRMMAQLEAFRCVNYNLFRKVLAQMLQHGQNLRSLAIENGCLSIQCIEQIATMKGLTDLKLNLYGIFQSMGRDTPVLKLPNLEHLQVSPVMGIGLHKQLPRLASVVIVGPQIPYPAKIKLFEIVSIDGIRGRRLRKLSFGYVTLDRESVEWLGSLSIDVLAFERCNIDGSLLDVLSQPESRERVFKIVLQDCVLLFQAVKPCNVRTVDELRTKCPYRQIASNGTIYK